MLGPGDGLWLPRLAELFVVGGRPNFEGGRACRGRGDGVPDDQLSKRRRPEFGRE